MVEKPDKNPMFFKGESYQGASKVIYPYGLNDVISHDKKDHEWKALVLENEYIKLCVTPEIGGKLYYATDKTNNFNFIYKNNVVRPSNIGMLGAWVSGGIEWCMIHHHRASTFMPVDYKLVENDDGSKTIWIGETEPRHRMRWTISITAFPGKSYFMAEGKIFNPTPYTHSFLYWANVAAHTNKDYQVIFPPSVNVATYHAKNSFTRWPFSTEIYNGQDFTQGVDISRWINSPNSNSFFAHDLKEDFMGGYDHGKETGTVHIGDHNVVKGAKLWEWGSGPRGQATEARLTENDGPYVEIMTGAFSDNQPDYSWIRPYELKTFRQYWYPVKDIGGFKNANLNGALNLEKRPGGIFIGFYSTQEVAKAKVTLLAADRIIMEKTVSVSPEKAYTEIIKTVEPIDETDLFLKIVNLGNGEELISYKPVKNPVPEELPATVKRPLAPSEIKTTEELYLTGSRILQFYNPTLNAMDYFNEALKRDPDDIRTNTAVGNILLKNGDYQKARIYLARAARRLTRDYTRPSSCEPLYLQGLVLRELSLLDEATDTLYRASWDYAWHSASYLELARISVLKGDYTKALSQAEEALATNARNNSAFSIKAAILRRLGENKAAYEILTGRGQDDPLDFRIRNEKYLAAKSAGLPAAGDLLKELSVEMRDFEQNYLELAAGYIRDGLHDEALEVLERYPTRHPLISYYKGYLSDIKGNTAQATAFFSEASAQPTDYVFPFRLETARVLEKALMYNQSDSRALYYLGNLFYDKQPEKAIALWEKAISSDPSLAIAHRNLGWGYYQHRGDGIKAIEVYEKALNLNRSEPVYFEELDALYEMSNAPVTKRISLFDGSNEVVSKRDDAFARQITVLTLAGRAEEAVKYLEGRAFSYREGSSRVRDIIIDAHLAYGIGLLKEKNYSGALEEFIKAQVPEEEAGGSRSGNRNLQTDYFIGLAYELLGKKSKSKEYFTLSTGQELRVTSLIKYYQGLSYNKLGKTKEAAACFDALIAEGDRLLKQSASNEIDFFAKFGEREAENARLSNAYLLKGLGYKGAGNLQAAGENLARALELSSANLAAVIEKASY
jgi:tetratricopeptide (TPR) repeat protein